MLLAPAMLAAAAQDASAETDPCSSSRLPEGTTPPACSPYGAHEEGRAVDWRLDHTDELDSQDGHRLLRILYAHGNELARRMGVQAILWGCHWWSSERPRAHHRLLVACRADDWRHADKGWRHDNHMHIELNWRGAFRQTSFWRLPRSKWRSVDPYRFDDSTHCTHRFQPGARALVRGLYAHSPRGEFKAADDNPPPGERCLPSF
jgi:hypothetical protein